MVVGGDLEVLRVGRADAIAQAGYEGGFIFDPKNSEAAVARHDTYWTGHPEGPTPGSKFANKSSVDSPSGIPR
jgi:hypothetical protein